MMQNSPLENDLDFYRNPKNIGNQKLVEETINYFENDSGARVFKPLIFLNLFWPNYKFVISNIAEPEKIFASFENLQLNDLEKHVLFGFLIKWFGGYPLDPQLDAEGELHYAFRKRLLEKFLNYEGQTPEKEFCKANLAARNDLMKLGIALTTAINTGIDIETIMRAMPNENSHQTAFVSFDDLFLNCFRAGMIGSHGDSRSFLIEKSKHNYQFNVWLQKIKVWENGNDLQYKSFLTVDFFKEYMKYLKVETEKEKFLIAQTVVEGYRVFQENFNQLAERFRIKTKATKEDCKKIPNLKEGDIIEHDPEYKTSHEAFALLTSYYAVRYLQLEKYRFIEKYKTWNLQTINAELLEIEKFLYEASKLNYSEACLAFDRCGVDSLEFVYMRLSAGFYENLEVNKFPLIGAIGNVESVVYGRFFLFYEFLKSQKKAYSKPQNLSEMLEFFESLEAAEKQKKENVLLGFEKLEKYIIENVHESVNENLQRLEQLQRNLINWKAQLRIVFIEPENQKHFDLEYFNSMKQNAERMEKKILTALEILQLRIENKLRNTDKLKNNKTSAIQETNKINAASDENKRTKNFIKEEFETIDINMGWKYAFGNESDYNIFLDLLTKYFQYESYTLPKQEIRLKKACKTRFAKALNPIHKELSEKPLKSDTEFLKIVRVFNHFKTLSDFEIYQAITR